LPRALWERLISTEEKPSAALTVSAFEKKIYDIFDVQLPRSAREQFMVGNKISKEELAIATWFSLKPNGMLKYLPMLEFILEMAILSIHPQLAASSA
jgi:hypothetical protein